MDEATGTVAEFTSEAEAFVALAQLAGEGIRAQVATLGGSGLPVAPFRVVVAPEDYNRAMVVLGQGDEGILDEGWEESAEAALDGWICSLCDTPNDLDEAFCTACGGSRLDVRAEDIDDED
ncbi:MAG: hypothetical protein U0840_12875 [Gemmataceae bacterium]